MISRNKEQLLNIFKEEGMRYFYFLFAFVISAFIGNYPAIGCGGDDNNNGGSNYTIDSSTPTVNCGGDKDD